MTADKTEVEVQQSTPQVEAEQLKAWLNNEQTQQTLAEQARSFEQNVGKNWFSLDRVMRKTQYKSIETAKTICDVLCLAGLAHSKFESGTYRYKITLNKEAKISALKADISAIDAQIILLQEKKSAILESISAQEAEPQA
jgi:hypothetical protein